MSKQEELIGLVPAESLNYETNDWCDGCDTMHTKEQVRGVMHHARGATGRVSPVLFLCHDCLKGRVTTTTEN